MGSVLGLAGDMCCSSRQGCWNDDVTQFKETPENEFLMSENSDAFEQVTSNTGLGCCCYNKKRKVSSYVFISSKVDPNIIKRTLLVKWRVKVPIPNKVHKDMTGFIREGKSRCSLSS